MWEEDDKSCNVKGRWEKKISGGSESKHKKKKIEYLREMEGEREGVKSNRERECNR